MELRQYVPTEVVAYIDQTLGFVPKDDATGGQPFTVSRGIRAALLGLVEIVDRVPVVDTFRTLALKPVTAVPEGPAFG